MCSCKEDRRIARILVKDFNYWRNCPSYRKIRVAQNDSYMYASPCEQRFDYADQTLEWFDNSKEAKRFVLKHIGINLFDNK